MQLTLPTDTPALQPDFQEENCIAKKTGDPDSDPLLSNL